MIRVINHSLDSNSNFIVDFENSLDPVRIKVTGNAEINHLPHLTITNNIHDVQYSIYFESIVFNCELLDQHSFYKATSIQFDDCLIDEFKIDQTIPINSLSFSYCFIENFEVRNVEMEELRFHNTFIRAARIENGSNKSVIMSLDIRYNYENSIDLFPKFNKELKKFDANNKFTSFFYITQSLEYERLYFGNHSNYMPENSFADLIAFDVIVERPFLNEKEERTYILNVPSFKSLSFKGMYANLTVKSIKVNRISFAFFKSVNASLSYISPIGNDSEILIKTTEFANCKFWKVDLKEFRNFKCYESNFQDSKFSLVSCPDKIISGFKLDEIYTQIPTDDEEHEYYRQFYLIYSSGQDFDNALTAKSKQLNSYFQTHKNHLSFEKKIIFHLSKWSNEFGTNWMRALAIWIILLPSIIYIAYLASLGIYLKLGHPIGWNFVSSFFEFINPTHSMPFLMEKSQFGNWTIPIDFLCRIVIGFGIYQFITAFRRYGKS